MSDGHQGLGILSPCSLGQDNPGSSGFVPRFYLFSSSQLLPTSQEDSRFENHTTHSVPDQACDQGLPDPNNSIQAKKVSEEGVAAIVGGKSPDYGLRSVAGSSLTFKYPRLPCRWS